jgi:hypothetical protein
MLNKLAITLARHATGIGRASNAILAVLIAWTVALFVFDVRPSLAFIPTLGAVHVKSALVIVSALLYLVAVVGRIVNSENINSVFVTLILALVPALIMPIGSWEWVHHHVRAQQLERTVAITSIGAQDPDEDPDCTYAYYFNDSLGNEHSVCTEDKTPLDVGSKARIVESKNFLGISIATFTPVSTTSATSVPAAH